MFQKLAVEQELLYYEVSTPVFARSTGDDPVAFAVEHDAVCGGDRSDRRLVDAVPEEGLVWFSVGQVARQEEVTGVEVSAASRHEDSPVALNGHRVDSEVGLEGLPGDPSDPEAFVQPAAGTVLEHQEVQQLVSRLGGVADLDEALLRGLGDDPAREAKALLASVEGRGGSRSRAGSERPDATSGRVELDQEWVEPLVSAGDDLP